MLAVIIFVGGVSVCVCVSSPCREAPGKTYVEKCLFFIRQMETDSILEKKKCVAPERGKNERN